MNFNNITPIHGCSFDHSLQRQEDIVVSESAHLQNSVDVSNYDRSPIRPLISFDHKSSIDQVDSVAREALNSSVLPSPSLPPSVCHSEEGVFEEFDLIPPKCHIVLASKKVTPREEAFLKNFLAQPKALYSDLWGAEQDTQLINLILSKGKVWSVIAKQMGKDYDASKCMHRFIHFYLNTLIWSPATITRLKEAVAQAKANGDFISWEKIADKMDGELPSEVYARFYNTRIKIDEKREKEKAANPVKKFSKWSDAHDKRIIELSIEHKKRGRIKWQPFSKILNDEFDKNFTPKDYEFHFRALSYAAMDKSLLSRKYKSPIKKLTSEQEVQLLKFAQECQTNGVYNWGQITAKMGGELTKEQYRTRHFTLIKLQKQKAPSAIGVETPISETFFSKIIPNSPPKDCGSKPEIQKGQESFVLESQNDFQDRLLSEKVVFISDQSTPLHFIEQHKQRSLFWSPEKNIQLRKLVAEFNGLPDWSKIAKEMSGGHNEKQCENHYHTLSIPTWTTIDDFKLNQLVQEWKKIDEKTNWDVIADHLATGHLNSECEYRYLNFSRQTTPVLSEAFDMHAAAETLGLLGKRVPLLESKKAPNRKRSLRHQE